LKSVFTKEYEQILSYLIEARKQAGLTQNDLALRLGRLQTFVSKYERGERRLDVIEFIYVARALGLKASELIANVEEQIRHADSQEDS
jgi:transcriptional regulator with XRE-family HTH domain